ncbi:MAG: SDR family oxidoreductase [Proteobacteria bacterium]|nr:SDR family oxidoreductase [Pseudomonadota bacterium]
MQVEGKVAVVTGGGTGVGRATALRLANLGCSVVVNYSRSESEAESVAAEAERAGVKALAVRADVSRDADCRALLTETERAFGALHVLVCNAGTTSFVPHADLEGLSGEDFDRILGVNLKGPFFCARAAKPLLDASDGGEIVMTSSVAGLAGVGSSIAYCASKAALNNLTVTLARVFAPRVRVNAVAPGFITGRWLREGLGAETYETVKTFQESKALLDRVCDPDDVAEAIVGIVTGTDLVTGHVLPVEGGMLLSG